MLLSESSIHFYLDFNSSCYKECWYFRIKWFLSKMRLPSVHNYARMCKDICSYNLVYNFLMQLLPLKVSFCGTLFKHILALKRDISERQFLHEIVPLLVVFHLQYSKYKGVKICFYPCHYQNPIFSLVLHSCRSCSTGVLLVSHSYYSCLTRVALVSLVLHLCCIRVVRVALESLVSDTHVVNQTRSFNRAPLGDCF